MTKPYDMHPTSDAEVFDMLHGLFGIGDYDEGDKKPWYRVRMVEVAKIKAIRVKRRWSFGDFATVARFCARHGVVINKAWDLLPHLGDAMLEQRNNARRHADDLILEAAALELRAGLPDSQEWAERLQLSAGHHRQELLEEWQRTRQRTLQEGMS